MIHQTRERGKWREMRSQRRGEPALQEVRPVLQEGFPTAGNWRSPSGVPKAYPKGFPDSRRLAKGFPDSRRLAWK
jgi:hypothetical protein